MTEVEQHVDWSSQDLVKAEVVNSMDYGPSHEKTNPFYDEFSNIPMIVVESNQQSENSDAPIVIYPNDPSVVGAEEVVEEQPNEIAWTGIVAEEEVVIPACDNTVDEVEDNRKDDFGDIPLNDETYATYHPFPCDFCCRRFKKKANLINHMVAHQTQRPHACNTCSSRFMRKCDLVNHMKIHAYVPNRDNRSDLEDDPTYTSSSRKRPDRRRRSSGSSRPYKAKIENRPASPSSSPDGGYYFKPTSYVDEDVKLLLEMTTKLHESRKSESNDATVTVVSPDEPKREGTEGKPYVCNKCGRCFARESALVSHTQVHAADYSYDCNKCGSRFFTMDLLKEHYNKKHDSVYMGDSSEDSEGPDGDRRSYTGDERFGTFYCPICSISFHRSDLLKQHKKIHSKRDVYPGLYRCGTCQTMFITNEKLLEHLDSSVNCQKNVCMICGAQFTDQTSVQSHIQAKHVRDLTANSCTYCGRQFRDPKALKKHLWVHVTNKKVNSSQDTSKTVSCDECEEEFTDRRALMNHRQSHYSSNAQRRFICHECGKSFGSRSSQQIHLRIHTGERPYGCRYCWKAFADGGTLRKHERIHTGEKPYVCAVCPRAFNQRVVLREHIRSHHSGSVNKMGYPVPVYMCPVCGVVTAGSEELALHIVKHSDDNTVKNRVPATGVRSYKRRKKAETGRDDMYHSAEFEEADFFDDRNSDTDSADSDRDKRHESKRTARGRRPNRYAKFNRTMDSAIKNITSLVEQPIRKAKMINTKLQPVPAKQKRGVKKRGRRAIEVSSVVTVLKPRVRTMSGRLSGRGDSISEVPEETPSTSAKDDEDEKNALKTYGRPRTKNVNYETLRALNKGLPPAMFPDHKEGAISNINVKDEAILKIETHNDVEEEEEGVRSDPYACSVCNVAFPSKADLLDHVPIHI